MLIITHYCTTLAAVRPSVSLTHHPPNLRGTPCQPLTFICETRSLQNHRWYFNGQEVVRFTYRTYPNRKPPIQVYDQNGIVIAISAIDYDAPQRIMGDFDVTTVLDTTNGALILAGINTLQCGSYSTRTSVIDLAHIIAGVFSIQWNLTHQARDPPNKGHALGPLFPIAIDNF